MSRVSSELLLLTKFNFSLLSKLKISAPSHAREEATTSDVLRYLQSWSPDTSQYVCYRGAKGQIGKPIFPYFGEALTFVFWQYYSSN